MLESLPLLEEDRYDVEQPYFTEAEAGWHGYIEWERYPERKKKAAELLSKHEFAGYPEFQLQPLPKTNPVLEGVRWKQYHEALGPTLANLPTESWETVKEEKAEDMIHILDFPYNGEAPKDRLMNDPVTPNELFFVRNHGCIPRIDPEKWYLDVEGLVQNPQRLTLKDLQDETKFPRQTTQSTIQCSGTRRMEQISLYPGEGDELINAPWGEGAIGTAVWTGVSLKKVIKHCGGLKDGAKHIEFTGVDTYFKKNQVMNYVVSVPWRKVKAHEVLLAWEMNGKPLPKIHGFPLRAVVFGYIGARSCKWLNRICAIPRESQAPVQKKEYLYYNTQQSKYNASWSDGFSIQDMPVASAIMAPTDMSVIVHDGHINMKGWAFSGGGHFPVRVEVSMDGGNIWYATEHDNMSKKHFHSWRLWSIDVPVDAEGWTEACVRCWDDACNTQPTFQRSAWNWDLHVTSSCHRIKIFSINRSKPKTARRLKAMEEKGEPIHPLTKPLGIDPETEEEYQAARKAQDGRDPVD